MSALAACAEGQPNSPPPAAEKPERFAPGRAPEGEPPIGCIECDWGEFACHCDGEDE